MYCPRCGTHNVDDAKFCRACGADLSLIPQALAGAHALLEVEGEGGAGKKGRKVKEPPTLEKGLENIFIGLALLIIFLLGLSDGAFIFWVWLLIPSLAYFGEGLGQIIRARRATADLVGASALRPQPPALPLARDARTLPPRQTSEIVEPPASVTEATTRHLGVTAERPTKNA